MTKNEQIIEIKAMIINVGTIDSTDLDGSICIFSKGNLRKNISELIETYYDNCVEVVTYYDQTPMSYDNKDYEDLSDDIIDLIHSKISEYVVSLEKTFKRSQN